MENTYREITNANKLLHEFNKTLTQVSETLFIINWKRCDMLIFGSHGRIFKFNGILSSPKEGLVYLHNRSTHESKLIVDVSTGLCDLSDGYDSTFMRDRGNSYLALTFGFNNISGGCNINVHHIFGLCKYGIEVMDEVTRWNSKYIVDHLNLNKTDNSFKNIEVIIRELNLPRYLENKKSLLAEFGDTLNYREALTAKFDVFYPYM